MAPISRKRHILDSLCETSSNMFSGPGSVSDGDSFDQKRTQMMMTPSPSTSPASSVFFDSDRNEGHNNLCSPPIRSTSFSSTISSSSCTSSNLQKDVEDGQSLRGTQFARVNRVVLDKSSDEYRKRRERNNIAVKKSRTKSKMKTMETVQKVNLLKAENDFLQRKVDILSRELRLLKEIFMAHASNAHGTQITEYDLRLLTGSDVMDIPLVASSSPSPGASVLFREAALQHLASSRASVIDREDKIRATCISSPDSFFFPSSRIYSPSSLSSRSSAHESEDDF